MENFMFDNTKKLTKNQKYTQAELFKMILENEDLREKTEALFALDFKELSSVKDEYPDYEFNIDGKVFAEDGGAGFIFCWKMAALAMSVLIFRLNAGELLKIWRNGLNYF